MPTSTDQAVGDIKDATEHVAPRSMPDIPDASSESVLDQSTGEEGDEGEMVPAAGRINEKGEVIDDDGNAIGRVTSGDPQKLAGFIVTQEGDVLDHDGGVVGKAEPLEDVASELNQAAGHYTTGTGRELEQKVPEAEVPAQTARSKSGLSGMLSGVGNVLGSVTGGLGKKPTKGVTDTADGVTKPIVEGDATGDIPSQAGDAVEGGVDTLDHDAQDLPEGVTGDVEGVQDEVGSKVSGVGSKVPTDALEGQSQLGSQADLGSKLGDVQSQIDSKAGELPEDLGSQADLGSKADLASQVGSKVPEDVGSKAGELPEDLGSKVEGLPDELGSKAEGLEGELGSKAGELQDLAPEPIPIEIPEFTPSVAGQVLKMFEGPFTVADNGHVTDVNGKILGKLAPDQDFQELIGKDIKGIDEHGNLLGDNETVLGKVDLVPEGTIVERIKDEVPQAAERLDAIEEAKKIEEILEDDALPNISILEGLTINKGGMVVDVSGNPLGRVKEGYDVKKLVGKQPDAEGRIWDSRGNIIGEVEVLPELVQNIAAPFEDFPDAVVDEKGRIMYEGRQVGVVVGDDWENLIGKKVDADGDIVDKNGNVIGKAERKEAEEAEPEPEPEPEMIDYSTLRDKKVNKMGNVVDEKGNIWGHVVQGILKHLVGKKVGDNGLIYNDAGEVIGKAEPIPDSEREEAKEPAPFEAFPGAMVGEKGKVMFNGDQVGIVVDGDLMKLQGMTVDADGDILDKNGNLLGRAERWEEEPEPEPEMVDYSMLRDKKVNKLGNVVDDKGNVWGHVVQGILKLLVGKKVGDNGLIYSDAGEVMGKAEPIPDSEREEMKEPAPFEAFPGAIVGDKGKVLFNGEQIGIVVEGDTKKLKGMSVDADGDILDRAGNTLGRAERWEEEEPEPEPEIDRSALAGKRINKAGNAVDKSGDIYGRVVEGELKRLIGKMCDKEGFIRNEGGDIIGRAELIPEAEREGLREGPFTELPGCTVTKDGTVVTPGGDIVGRLTEGDPKRLFGRVVDDDGDICDKNGNVLGRAERWEPEEVPKDVNPMSGRRVNREGNVVDENGDIMGKLTSGDVSKCAGKKIDDDGDVVDAKGTTLGHVSLLEEIEEPKDVNPMSGRKVNREGNVVDEAGNIIGKLTSGELTKCAGKKIDNDGDVVDGKGSILGHVSLLEDIPPEPVVEETESEEDKAKRLQLEQDRQIAGRICMCIEHSLDKIRPICQMITNLIDKAERTPEDERDEEELVKQVRPLIEEGGKILTEANGVIRGLDPDGRISANAKHKTMAREATPEEYRLADLLKELTGTVTETIENAKRKIEDMPHAKKELNPLWGLLAEPLFQIIAAVGLLLTGVLGLVGKLLNGLGLGGLVNNLLGGLGLTRVLEGLGLGSLTDALGGKQKGKKNGSAPKKSGGGLLGLGIL